MGTWGRMFISEITATQDEINQYGWAGDVVFTQYIPRSEQYYSEEAAISTTATTTTSTRRTTNNSSTKKNTGTKAAATSATAGAISAITKLAGAGGGALRLIVAK